MAPLKLLHQAAQKRAFRRQLFRLEITTRIPGGIDIAILEHRSGPSKIDVQLFTVQQWNHQKLRFGCAPPRSFSREDLPELNGPAIRSRPALGKAHEPLSPKLVRRELAIGASRLPS